MKGCYLTKHAPNTIFNCITSALTKSDFTYATYGAMLQCLMFMRHYHYLRRVGESSIENDKYSIDWEDKNKQINRKPLENQWVN